MLFADGRCKIQYLTRCSPRCNRLSWGGGGGGEVLEMLSLLLGAAAESPLEGDETLLVFDEATHCSPEYRSSC
jgi:hypothetical protein